MNDYPVKLVSDKILNKFTFPVVSIKGKQIKKYPIIYRWNDISFKCVNGIFGAEERMIMDLLGTITVLNEYYGKADAKLDFSKMIPTSRNPIVQKKSAKDISYKTLLNFAKNCQNFETDIIPGKYFIENKLRIPSGIRFTDRTLKNQLPFMSKYTSKNFYNSLKRTSECKIQMIYHIRYFDGNEYRNFKFANVNIPSRIFNLIEVKETQVSKDNKVLERGYIIAFNTILGYIYIQNILSCYTDLLPGHFYLMSEYAQLFYRLLILPFYNNVKIPISLDEIKARLVLKSENYMCRKTVRRILDELQSNRLITNPKEILQYDAYWYSYEKCPWSVIVGID